MTDWQPIHTAPKDGRRIMVCCAHGTTFMVEIAAWGVFRKRSACWKYNSPMGVKMEVSPFCWAPLPFPPQS